MIIINEEQKKRFLNRINELEIKIRELDNEKDSYYDIIMLITSAISRYDEFVEGKDAKRG